jgi:hypothetical protein
LEGARARHGVMKRGGELERDAPAASMKGGLASPFTFTLSFRLVFIRRRGCD